MKAKTVVLSTALAGMLAAASAVHAVDVKVYSGSACQPFFGSQAADFIIGNNGIFNDGAGNPPVVCPIVRDNHNNPNGVSVGVRVRSPNATPLFCTLDSWTALGVFVASNTNSTTSSTAINLPLDINLSTKGGAYTFFCYLPPGAQVYGYRVEEF